RRGSAKASPSSSRVSSGRRPPTKAPTPRPPAPSWTATTPRCMRRAEPPAGGPFPPPRGGWLPPGRGGGGGRGGAPPPARGGGGGAAPPVPGLGEVGSGAREVVDAPVSLRTHTVGAMHPPSPCRCRYAPAGERERSQC